MGVRWMTDVLSSRERVCVISRLTLTHELRCQVGVVVVASRGMLVAMLRDVCWGIVRVQRRFQVVWTCCTKGRRQIGVRLVSDGCQTSVGVNLLHQVLTLSIQRTGCLGHGDRLRTIRVRIGLRWRWQPNDNHSDWIRIV